MPANLRFNARQGVLGQLVEVKETDGYDVDPAVPVSGHCSAFRCGNGCQYVAVESWANRRWQENLQGFLARYDRRLGDVPTSLDFNYVGHDLICHLGEEDPDGNPTYTRVNFGGYSTHRWAGWGMPISFQLEKRHQQATAIHHRHKGMFSTIMAFRPAAAGQSAYTMSHLGVGDLLAHGHLGHGMLTMLPSPRTITSMASSAWRARNSSTFIAFTLMLDAKVYAQGCVLPCGHGGGAQLRHPALRRRPRANLLGR